MLRQHQIDWDGRFPECSDESFGWSLLDTYVNELSHSIGCPGYLQPFTYPHQNEASMNPHGVGYFTTHANLSVFFKFLNWSFFVFGGRWNFLFYHPSGKKAREGIHFSCGPQNVNVYSSPAIFSLYTLAYIPSFIGQDMFVVYGPPLYINAPREVFFIIKPHGKIYVFHQATYLAYLAKWVTSTSPSELSST